MNHHSKQKKKKKTKLIILLYWLLFIGFLLNPVVVIWHHLNEIELNSSYFNI